MGGYQIEHMHNITMDLPSVVNTHKDSTGKCGTGVPR